jgi:hypothetical protein
LNFTVIQHPTLPTKGQITLSSVPLNNSVISVRALIGGVAGGSASFSGLLNPPVYEVLSSTAPNSAGPTVGVARGVVSLNLNSSQIFSLQAVNTAYTLNVTTPTGLNANQVVSFSLFVFADVSTGTTVFDSISINGSVANPLWPNGANPTGSMAGIDFYAFTIIKNTSGEFSLVANHINYV